MSRVSDQLALAKRLTKRVSFYVPVDAADGAGGLNRSWKLHARVWAEVTPRSSGHERALDGQLAAQAQTKFIIRYRDDITEAMRLNYNGQAYQIRRLTDLYERGVALEILAERGVAL